MDYEGELAVVIGFWTGGGPAEPATMSKEDALGFVLGYTCARTTCRLAVVAQASGSGGQFANVAEGFNHVLPDRAGICGAASGVGDPGSLRLVTRVNGEVRQESSTGDDSRRRDVFRMRELSKGMTLLPGTM